MSVWIHITLSPPINLSVNSTFSYFWSKPKIEIILNRKIFSISIRNKRKMSLIIYALLFASTLAIQTAEYSQVNSTIFNCPAIATCPRILVSFDKQRISTPTINSWPLAYPPLDSVKIPVSGLYRVTSSVVIYGANWYPSYTLFNCAAANTNLSLCIQIQSTYDTAFPAIYSLNTIVELAKNTYVSVGIWPIQHVYPPYTYVSFENGNINFERLAALGGD
jgi:hypothetical protein